MFKQIILASLFILTSLGLNAQIIVPSGQTIIINSNTQLSLQTVADSLFIEDSSQVINHGIISLTNGSRIYEQSGYPISGTGWEQVRDTNVILNSNNFGNLGFVIHSDSISENLLVKRFHSDTLNEVSGLISVLRYFSVHSLNDLGTIEVVFNYDTSEQNSLNHSYLKLVAINSGIAHNYGGNATSQASVSASSSDTGVFVLTETYFNTLPNSDTSYCLADSIQINLSANGIYNPGNLIYIQLTNGTDTIVIDTISTLSFTGILPDTLIGNYNLFATSSSPLDTTQNLFNFNIYGLPIIDTNAIDFSYCTYENSQVIAINPSGGVFTGNGIVSDQFDPQIAGLGSHMIYYEFTDTNSCFALDSFLFVVNDIPVLSLNSISAICINSDSLLLNQGLPSGGTYFGNGVNSPYLIPGIAGVGSNLVYYTFVDSNGCTDTVNTAVNVLAAPITPTVYVDLDTLSTDVYFSYQWLLNGDTIIGATFQDYLVTQNGNYQVLVSNSDGCYDTSISYNFQSTGWLENSTLLDLKLFPNPANSILNIHCNDLITEFTIYDTKGSVVLAVKAINEKELSIDISKLQNGLYFIKTNGLNKSLVKKFIIQH